MISLVRRNKMTYRSSALLICVTQVIWLLGSGCSMPTDPKHPELKSVVGQLKQTPHKTGLGASDGEALYRGIFFAQGTILQQVPELEDILSWKNSVSQSGLSAMNDMVDDIVPAIASAHSGFFAYFSTEMRSGNQIRVLDVLHEASEFTKDALFSLPEYENMMVMTPSEKEQAQDDLLTLYNASQISQDDYEYMSAMLMIEESGGDDEIKFKLLVGWAVALGAAYAYVLLGNPCFALAVAGAYAIVVALDARVPGAELERDELVNDITTRLAN